jgi:hypothetical protein
MLCAVMPLSYSSYALPESGMNLRRHRIDNERPAGAIRAQQGVASYGYTEHSGSCLFGVI